MEKLYKESIADDYSFNERVVVNTDKTTIESKSNF